VQTSKSRTGGLRSSTIGPVDASDCKSLPRNHFGLLLQIIRTQSQSTTAIALECLPCSVS